MRNTQNGQKLRSFAYNSMIFLGIFAAAVAVCFACHKAAGLEAYASPIFVLAVLLISRLTDSYLYGLAASVLGVVCVNFFFTYPYMAVNFSISGYPLTFLTLLIVSLVTSTLTTRAKQRDLLEQENEKEKIRSDLLRSVTHDIRTPLTSIIGSTAVLIEDDNMSRQEEKELLQDVRGQAKWLLRMTENLLLISKIDQASTIHLEPWAVEEVIAETIMKIQKTYPGTEVEVSIPETPLFVPMDPILIGQVLFNLAENGILHGNGTTIWLEVRKFPEEVLFCVRDDGRGFPDDMLEAFEAGRLWTEIRPDSRRDPAGKGNAGLGLRVCNTIIRAHKGRMVLENVQNGACAKVYLPAGQDQEEVHQ